ncbi:hypothetical protein K1719_038472 [Acacia pycnantha]|nr:hypothetical protein K1719_038472 [Acacia pycnantha]
MSDNIPFIPLQILEKILINLDIKTLIRCASVCRDWNSLITGPDFIFRQVILLRSLEKKKDNGFKDGWNIVLWNPTIQKCVLLPRLTMTSVVSLGFGFIRKSNDFKVVKLVSHPDGRVHSAWVFSYLTWSWKHVARSTPPPCHINNFSSPVLINGVLHWIGGSIDRKYEFILTFDLANEVFGETSLPRDDICIPFSIVAAGDSIAVSQMQYISRVETMSVWVMKQRGVHESWVKIFTTTKDLGPVHRVLDIRKNGDMILHMGSGKIMKYNSSTSKTNVLQGVAAERRRSSFFIGNHVENLFLLDRAEEVN